MKKLLIGSFFLLAPLLTFAQNAGKGPEGVSIAYNVAKDIDNDNYEVFIMNADGTSKRNLTKNPDVAWAYYAWESDIYIVSDRDSCKRCYHLYRLKPDGSKPKRISSLRLEDSWMGSRSGGREMVVAGRIGNKVRYQLFLVDTASGGYKQLTNEPEAMFRDPVFSPDGKRIVYAYKKERKNRASIDELYIMNADGSGKRRLTFYPEKDRSAAWHNYHAGPPRWNRKLNFISYQSVQNGKSSLFAVSPDGKRNWKLTGNELNEGWHDWSPDGKWLAVEMYNKEQTEYGIYLLNFETKELRKLTDPADFRYQQAPVFVLDP